MTREEAIIQSLLGHIESLEETIKALKQEPYENAVSRQSVKDGMIKYGFHAPDMTVTEFVEDMLPPVTPTRKKGKWIEVTETDFGIGYKCSECGRFIFTEGIDGRKLKDFPYCHCGAEMESEE